MFETTVVESRPQPRRRWTKAIVVFSLVAHLVAGAAIFISSLFGPFPVRTPSMMESYRWAMMPAMAPPPPPPPPPPQARVQTAMLRTAAPDVAPTEIPETIPELTNEPIPEVEPETTVAAGVPGGTIGGVEGGTSGGIVSVEPPVRIPGTPLIVARDASLPMVAMSMTYPEYPEKARLRGIEGAVIVRYKIDKGGKVREVEILRPSDTVLNEAAVKAIKYWRFRPMMENGQPIEVVHELTVRFVLQHRSGSGGVASLAVHSASSAS